LRRHAVEALAAAAVALLLTLIIAWPVLLAPSERLFGAEIVGRHHDPFTVIQQLSTPTNLGLYAQPVTDVVGSAIARVLGPVAAYNWLVLLSFPLSAAAAYLLARHLALPPLGAMVAALLFAFSPFHLAQAAYHPHIAQTQWLPLYLLALWRCMDRATPSAVALLVTATIAVTLSNFYAGLIVAVMTPAAIGGYWFARARSVPHAARHTATTIGTLAVLAVAGIAWVWWTAPAVIGDRAAIAFTRDDLFRYSAKWWSYLVPPVAHPMLGELAGGIWSASNVREGLLEQQVSLGWSVVILGVIALYAWLAGARRSAVAVAVPMLAMLAFVALVCSLSPERTILGVTVVRPSALLYPIVPMFRAYARFGVIVQLAAALLAGIGVCWLLARRTVMARTICASLVAVAIAEYAVWPPALSRDVLPTAAHRWAMQQVNDSRIVDCASLTAESSSISWLTNGRIQPLDGTFENCAEPDVAARLAAAGFTHVIVRDGWERRWLNSRGGRHDFRLAARFADADVLAVAPRHPLVYTQQIVGLSAREHDGDKTWRWMGAGAAWTIVAPASRPRVTLDLEMSAFHIRRRLAVRLDGEGEQSFDVDPGRRTYRIGPLALTAGHHLLTFHSTTPPTPADEVLGNGDRRPLSVAMGVWKWSAQ
jgi:hypothetical protein